MEELARVSLHVAGISGRTFADVLLFGVTAAEMALLAWLTPTFGVADWIYLTQHLVVLGVALTRSAPQIQDRSLPSNAAVLVAYTYPYAQMLYLRWVPDEPGGPEAGLVLVTLAACLSLASLLTLGRRFGIRPALRDLTTRGPYRLVRHPMYLAYVLADIGYNLVGWNGGTMLLVLAGWAALIYRIRAEERVLAGDPGWVAYAARVRSRLLPGIW
jgi:protein-S-isoprenylcysteine O-methyltransferase Ste14